MTQQPADGAVVWLTGLPSAGKTTLATALAAALRQCGRRVVVLDGDAVRAGLSADLGFAPADRAAHAQRVAFVAACVEEAGGVAVVGLISPYASDRAAVRAQIQRFLLVHVATPLAVCEARDVKGLYARARRGELAAFTGVSAPYEAPDDAEVVVETSGRTVDACVADIVDALVRHRWHRAAASDTVAAHSASADAAGSDRR